MRYEIHFTTKDGRGDYVVVEGDTVEEIREKAEAEVSKRDGRDPWSKEI